MIELPKDEDEFATVEKAPLWIVSLGDMAALMLSFFIMLFAMSSPQPEKFDKVMEYISKNLDPTKQSNKVEEWTIDLIGGLSPEYLNRVLVDKFSRDKILSQAHLVEISQHTIISLPADLIFESGGREINKNAGESIRRLAGVISQFNNQVDIVGHSDPAPIVGSEYPTNWDLSLARALSMANALTGYGYAGEFNVSGQADGRYRFLDDRLSEDKRYELARRVDIVVKPDAGGQL